MNVLVEEMYLERGALLRGLAHPAIFEALKPNRGGGSMEFPVRGGSVGMCGRERCENMWEALLGDELAHAHIHTICPCAVLTLALV
jgi:hypothetical protein